MNIIRTFHPIGQGAFYTERFYDDQKQLQYTIVFDCGYLWEIKDREKKLVTHTFDKNDTIDYLFISHLDRDHISLVDTLLSHVRRVRHIVLPLITDEDLVIALTLHKVANNTSSARFVSRILSHLRGERGDDYMGGDYSILCVGDSERQGSWKGGSRLTNGQALYLGCFLQWVFIPFNVESVSRREELKKKLAALLLEKSVKDEIRSYGETVSDSDGFFNKLKDAGFVENVIRNNGILLKKLKDVYSNIGGTINDNSLQLYSGPADVKHTFSFLVAKSNWRKYYTSRRVACLYTGDCQFDIDTWKNIEYKKVWSNVGTIQLPHHGSKHSFDISKNPLKESYVCVASCGNPNTFGHPSDRVLEYLFLCNSCFHIVTESINSIYMQKISENA